MNSPPGPIPEYEKAHRYSDTLFPRELWEPAQIALETVSPLLRTLAASVGAGFHSNPSAKHPHPKRTILKAGARGDLELLVIVQGRQGVQVSGIDDLQCVVGRKWTPRSRFLRRRG